MSTNLRRRRRQVAAAAAPAPAPTAGSSVELIAALSDSGTGPSSNDPLGSTWRGCRGTDLMPRLELPHLRQSRSATFDNGDGTKTLEIGNHFHHRRNGLFVPTDLSWRESAAAFDMGEYPVGIGLDKATRTLTLDFGTDALTLKPRSARVPTAVNRTAETVTLVRLWTGITLRLVLTPEGVCFHYLRTAQTIVNPQWTVTGDWLAHYGPNRYEVGMESREVPQSFSGGVLAYDFSGVPLNTLVV